MKLWLWKNGDHYWAFAHLYPCHPNGDPMTLGEPVGYALLKESVSRRETDTSATALLSEILDIAQQADKGIEDEGGQAIRRIARIAEGGLR